MDSDKVRSDAKTYEMGRWIWTDKVYDNQICRLWRSFDVPAGAVVSSAMLSISVDNGYRLLLDDQEIGQGSDWRCITVYDLTWMLKPGPHVLAVEAHNDTLEAGVICGLNIELTGRPPIKVASDTSWRIASNTDPKWAKRKLSPENWPQARIVEDKYFELWPKTVSKIPPLHPQIVHFWQTMWFQLSLAIACGISTLAGIWLAARLAAQTKAQALLQQERIRIAQDIHDDIGSRVTELLLLGELSRREQAIQVPSHDQMHKICDQARGLALALDEVVWAVNAKRDTVKDFSSYVCRHAQTFLKSTDIRCRLDVEMNIPADALPLYVRRNLFLAVKEALNNAAKHSHADELHLRIHRSDHTLFVEVTDNGRGFDARNPAEERNGLANMSGRLTEIDGTCEVISQPGAGCRVTFSVPIPREFRRWWQTGPAKA